MTDDLLGVYSVYPRENTAKLVSFLHLTHRSIGTLYGEIWGNICQGNVLLHYGIKPFSEPIVTYHWRCSL